MLSKSNLLFQDSMFEFYVTDSTCQVCKPKESIWHRVLIKPYFFQAHGRLVCLLSSYHYFTILIESRIQELTYPPILQPTTISPHRFLPSHVSSQGTARGWEFAILDGGAPATRALDRPQVTSMRAWMATDSMSTVVGMYRDCWWRQASCCVVVVFFPRAHHIRELWLHPTMVPKNPEDLEFSENIKSLWLWDVLILVALLHPKCLTFTDGHRFCHAEMLIARQVAD